MKTKLLSLILLFISSFSIVINSQDCNKNYLSVSGNKLYDTNGNEVRLTGVNWFGFETSMGYFHGIWSRDLKSMLLQIKDQGFNCIRIPWNNGMLSQDISGSINPYGTDPYTSVSPMNEEESTKSSPIEILDIAIEWCQENNMKVILDNHSRKADGYMEEALWYTDNVSQEQWIEDWQMMAERYKDYDAVVAMDINNEPHGSYGAGSRWGTGDVSNDWRLAAQECGNAILEVNPNVIIMVEGTEEFGESSYWWGGNLQGAKDYPVVLSNPNKLMYSPHEYGPTVFAQEWFSASDFPDNMPDIWETNFNYLHTNGTSPLLIGEFGIRDEGGDDEIWFDKFLEFMGEKGLSWTYWCWNPNSGDTGGLLDDSWTNIVEWKMAKLRPYLAPEIPNCAGEITTDPDTVVVVDTVFVTGVELSPASLNISVGETSTLTATVYPTDATNKNIIWVSDDAGIATVNTNGIVTAISEGSTTINVITENGGYTAFCDITVEPADTLECDFGTPLNTPLPSINSTFKYVYVSAGGPDLSNLSDFTINWDLENNGLWQLSINTTDGQPNYWNDLTTNAIHTFSSSSPSLTLSETGFEGLDAEYYVAIDNDNFAMVEVSGLYSIYFSNSSIAPCSNLKETSTSIKKTTQESTLNVYPNPFNSTFYVELKNAEIKDIKLYNSLGKLMKINAKVNSNSKATIAFNGESGLYFLEVQTDGGNSVRQILKLR